VVRWTSAVPRRGAEDLLWLQLLPWGQRRSATAPYPTGDGDMWCGSRRRVIINRRRRRGDTLKGESSVPIFWEIFCILRAPCELAYFVCFFWDFWLIFEASTRRSMGIVGHKCESQICVFGDLFARPAFSI
jgi:hypothetical protein